MRRLISLSLLLAAAASAQVVPGVLRHASYEAPPDSGAWSTVELGSGTCTTVSDVAGTLTITAAGTSIDDGCFVYQTISADPSRAGAQVYGRISSVGGTAATTTKVGPMIANSGLNTAAHCTVRWREQHDDVSGVYQVADGQSDLGGVFGQATALPLHLGVSFVDSTNRCKMYEYTTATVPANPLTDFDGVPQPHTFFPVDMSNEFLAGFFVQSGHATNTAEVTITDYDVDYAVTLQDNYTSPRDVLYMATWETGTIQQADSLVDGKYAGMLRNDVDGLPIFSSTEGCAQCSYDFDTDTPDETYDIQIVKTATPPTADGVANSDGTVTPIEGSFMSKHTIYSTKDYGPLNNGLDKPRTKMNVGTTQPAAVQVNQNWWIGFSLFIPSNYDRSPTNQRVQVFQMDADGSPTGIAIIIFDHEWGTSTQKGNRWSLKIERDAGPIYYYIGDDLITDVDVGVWTSFVMNIYFDAGTDPTNAFIKIWKSEGVAVSGQCRGFPTNPQVDYSGGPVGETTGGTAVNVKHPRIYKGTWKSENPLEPGPIEFYFDAQYSGPANGTVDSKTYTTTFEDVNPCMLSVGSAVY